MIIEEKKFDALPDEARSRVYRRLYDILTGRDTSKPFDALAANDRQAVLEILRETKKGLPDYWTAKSE